MPQFDTVIRGGTVVDGTRLPRVRADVGIKHGRVAKIGRIAAGAGARELDASGQIVAPGFVDLHCHYDAQIHWDPYCTISGWHGVTSLVLGNCGFGFAPVRPADRERALLMMTRTEQIPYESMKAGMPWAWESFPEWLDNLERLPKGVNIVSYVPVSPLMVYVMGVEASKTRAATPAERREMQRLLDQAMDAGACGFSVQRLGERSLQADYDGTPMPTDCMADEDLFALGEVLRKRDEGFIQITQAQAGNPVDATPEAIARDMRAVERLAEIAGRPVLHNVVTVVDQYPDAHKQTLQWIHDCNARGLRIVAQGANVRTWFQYSLEHWNLYDSAPAWNHATQGTHAEKLRKLADPEIRRQMKDQDAQLITLGAGGPIAEITVASDGGNAALAKYLGRTIGEIASEERKHPIDALLDIAVAGDLKPEFRTGTAGPTFTNADEMARLMSDPYVIPGVSDGGAHTKFFTGGSYPTDMLAWLVRDTGKMSLEEAHWHLSYLPAQAAGFLDRGFLREGAPADIVVYDLARLRRVPEWDFEVAHDFPANEWRRIQRAEGYRFILVNGEVTFEEGKCTGATPGKLLRNGRVGEASGFAA
ncbi:MAG: amidohydrolase family protein [Deltaproteobacteria bacterium]|nr:amidohydrolase family protein [Deltaproteobacteria bacterium]